MSHLQRMVELLNDMGIRFLEHDVVLLDFLKIDPRIAKVLEMECGAPVNPKSSISYLFFDKEGNYINSSAIK